MKILQVHNFYKFSGGEDQACENERNLLESNGHQVIRYEKDNSAIDKMSAGQKLSLMWKTTWNKDTIPEVTVLLRREKPDVCHVHNFFPLISPSVYQACKNEGVPVVQTLHNFRLMCANGIFLRDGQACEKCLHHSNFNAVRYKCYRDSAVQSLAVEHMITTHQKRNTWNKLVDAFICLSEFSKQKFVQAGLAAEKIRLKPNFLFSDPDPDYSGDGSAIFVGRFEEAKGAQIILQAARKLPDLEFNIVGEVIIDVKKADYPNIRFLGKLPHQQVIERIRESSFMVFPSLCYEQLPLTIIEAFACGKPVIASHLGNMKNMVEDKLNGLFFETGNPDDLVAKVSELVNHPGRMNELGKQARQTFEKRYTADTNYEILIKIYKKVIGETAKVNML
ncbi:MAG: glycosyltransferase family 4 protein [Bacteroidia bacterium]